MQFPFLDCGVYLHLYRRSCEKAKTNHRVKHNYNEGGAEALRPLMQVSHVR